MEKDYRDRVVEMVNVKASDLVLNHHNPSVHSDQQKIIMEEMLESTGFVGAIKGRRVGEKIEILDGHLRAQLAGDEIVAESAGACDMVNATLLVQPVASVTRKM